MKILGNRVLVKQVLAKKDSKIVLLDNDKNKENVYDSTITVLQLGTNVNEETDAIVGKEVAINPHATPLYVNILEKTTDKIESELVFHFDDIILIK